MRALAAVLVLLLMPAAHAELQRWDVNISLEDDGTARWNVVFQYKENISRSDYYILAKVTEPGVLADGRFVDYRLAQQSIGTSIVVEGINASRVEYRFRTLGLVSDFAGFSNFNYRFTITELTDAFTVTVKLPLGFGIAEKSKLKDTGLNPFEPVWGTEGSDGRSIYLFWQLEKPRIGQAHNVLILYERVLEINQVAQNLAIVILVTIVVLFIVYSRKRRYDEVLPVLTEGERKVVEILLREKKDTDQRRLVTELDYSKAKVSRIVQNLVQRGLIESVRKGRTNLIRLKKLKKTEEMKQENKTVK
ncbi:MAG: hypothetical protein HYY37_02485 [Candidatus Aenigmarchaeota archaeon]|nr:hypothetical protein [Candidatus Aenigmarchaeota archaeon]